MKDGDIIKAMPQQERYRRRAARRRIFRATGQKPLRSNTRHPFRREFRYLSYEVADLETDYDPRYSILLMSGVRFTSFRLSRS